MRTWMLMVGIMLLAACGGKDGTKITVDTVDIRASAETVNGDVCSPTCDGKNCGDNGCGGTCGECTPFVQTCTEGVCIAHPCQSSVDCPGSLVCADDKGECVVCVGDEDCSDGQTCGADNECHEEYLCTSDLDCKQYGLVCDKDVGKCVECLKASHCEEGEFCKDNYCVAAECTAGESKCQDNEVVTCAEDGSGWETTSTCKAAQYCEEAECKDFVCTPDDIWCDGEIYKVCSEDGKSVKHEEDCGAGGKYCSISGCIDTVCEPDSKFCVDNFTKGVCNEDGMDFFSDPCPEQHFCEMGACWAWVCSPGETFCEGNTAKVCDLKGSGVLNEVDCGGKVCMDGQCQDLVCQPNQDYCVDNDSIGHCAADGMSFQPEDCIAEHSCNDGSCQAWVCTPGEAMCEGEVATACDGLGLGTLPGGQDCGLQQKSCVDGTCVACVPECGDQECGDNGCGGTCGECEALPGAACVMGVSCVQGACEVEVEQFFCVVKGSCVPSGTENPDNMCEKCQPNESQKGWSAVPDSTACGSGLECHGGVCCPYDCDGKVCGDNGCGGTCGECAQNIVCVDGLCSQCDDGNDVNWDGCTDGEVSEFRVNSYTASAQEGARPATASSGRFIFVWSSLGQDGDGQGVFGRLYDMDGNSEGPDFLLSTYTTGYQSKPAVSWLETGGFAAAWESYEQDGDGTGVFAQVFDDNGVKVGDEFQVGTKTADNQEGAMVTGLKNGDFLVFWIDSGSMWGQFFSATGDKMGGAFDASYGLGSHVGFPAALAWPNGEFVVAYESILNSNDRDVFCQLFNSNGTPDGSHIVLNDHKPNKQTRPVTALLSTGDFVVVWQGPGVGEGALHGRFVNSDGSLPGAEFTLDSLDKYPEVAALNDGRFVVVAVGNFGGDGPNITLQLLNDDGTKDGGQFLATKYILGQQNAPRMVSFADSSFVVTWTSNNQEGTSSDIYAQRFDKDGNKIYH